MSVSWLLIPGVILLIGGWMLFQLTVQNGRLMLRLDALEKQLIEQAILPDPEFAGLSVGTVLPDFSLPALHGGATTLSKWRGRRLLLAFVNPHCSFSRDFVEQLSAAPQPAASADPIPLLVTTGDAAENRRWFEEFPVPYPVLLQDGGEVSSLYRLRGTPTGYLVDEQGLTASGALTGAGQLLETAGVNGASGLRRNGRGWRPLRDSHIARDGLKAGTPAPDFTLPSLDGVPISLSGYRGRKVLLVFSDPECAPCMRLAPSLEELHRKNPEIAVLMISRGDAGANRRKAEQLNLTFPILLQKHWEISRAYAMFATPVGYLIGEEGVLISDVAVAGEAILGLASPAAALAGPGNA